MRKLFLSFRITLLLLFVMWAFPVFASIVVEEVVARVGNEIITKTEYEKEQKRLYDQLSKHYQGEDLKKQYAEQSNQLLEFMIDQKLLEQRARELDLNVEDEIKAAVQKLREENNLFHRVERVHRRSRLHLLYKGRASLCVPLQRHRSCVP